MVLILFGIPNRKSFWNLIPDQERNKVVEFALDNIELSPRELASHITDNQGWFISESSVFKILKMHVQGPFIVIKAMDYIIEEYLPKS